MTRKDLYIAVAILAVVIVAAIVGGAYLSSAKDVAKDDAVRQMVKEQVEKLRADLQPQLAAIAQDKKQIQTPQQIVVKIPEYVSLPVAPIVMPTAPASTTSSSLPDSPGQMATASSGAQPTGNFGTNGGIYFPSADVKPLFDKLADCKACDLERTELKSENALLIKRVKTAEDAMKGGSFWQRVKSNGKWLAIGAAGGAVAYGVVKR